MLCLEYLQESETWIRRKAEKSYLEMMLEENGDQMGGQSNKRVNDAKSQQEKYIEHDYQESQLDQTDSEQRVSTT